MLVLPIFSKSSELLGAMALHNFPLESTGTEQAPSIGETDLRFLEGLADLAGRLGRRREGPLHRRAQVSVQGLGEAEHGAERGGGGAPTTQAQL